MKKTLKLFFIFLVMFASLGPLYASGDKILEVRFYEGSRESGEKSGALISSFYLKGLSRDHFTRVSKETRELKRVYNLKELRESYTWYWDITRDSSRSQHDLNLGGDKKLTVLMYSSLSDKDRFKVIVFRESENKDKLLESEIFIPEQKTAVMGFEDSENAIYFLAINRKKDMAFSQDKKPEPDERPKLIKQVTPIYPEKALAEKLAGEVILDGTTDIYGRVTDIEVLVGNPILAEAAKQAAFQWIYTPWIMDGIPQPVNVKMIVIFIYEENPAVSPDQIEAAVFEKNKAILSSAEGRKEDILFEMIHVYGKRIRK